MRFILILSLCIVGFTYHAQAQTSKKSKNKSGKVDRSNSFEPYSPAEVSAPEKSSKRSSKKSKKESFSERYFKSLQHKREDFYDRMEANAKKYKKMQKEMEKPQYSDPMYFGHKKKPKKRPPGKRKFCKECGMVH